MIKLWVNISVMALIIVVNNSAFAASLDGSDSAAADYYHNFAEMFAAVVKYTLMAVCYCGGLWATSIGLLTAARHNHDPYRNSFRKASGLFLFGLFLLRSPSVLAVTGLSLFGTTEAGSLSLAGVADQALAGVINDSVLIVAAFGYWTFVRSIIIATSLSTGRNRYSGWNALTFAIAGVVLVYVPMAVRALQESIGFSLFN